MSELTDSKTGIPEVRPERRCDRHGQAAKLHLWLGVLPLSCLLVLHLAFNAVGAWAPEALRPLALRLRGGLPFALEVALVWLPLSWHLVHAIRSPLAGLSRRERGWFWLTGTVALGFGGFHWWVIRRPLLSGERIALDSSSLLGRALSSTGDAGVPWTALAYLVGIAALCAHVGRGSLVLWNRARPVSTSGRFARGVLITGVTLAVLGIGAATVVEYGAGSALP